MWLRLLCLRHLSVCCLKYFSEEGTCKKEGKKENTVWHVDNQIKHRQIHFIYDQDLS